MFKWRWSNVGRRQRDTGPPSVIVAQNYSLAETLQSVEAGKQPRQHLWGADALQQAGMTVSVLGSPKTQRLRPVSRRLGYRLGDLSRQLLLVAEVRRQKANVVVCAETGFARGLAILRKFGVLRVALVGVQHPYEPRRRIDQFAASGFDRLILASDQMAASMGRNGTDRRWSVAHWGPDLTFPGYYSSDEGFVVCTGRTHRDLETLAAAAAAANVNVRFHPPRAAPQSEGPTDPYEAALDDLRRASVVAIPLVRTDGTFGHTELMDALALRKPIVMTRNPYLDIDVEGLGCGVALDPGDVAGWTSALARLMSDERLRRAMGERSRLYAESGRNYASFCSAVVSAVEEVAQPRVSH